MMLNIIYDGETEFTSYSLRSMIADSKKEANLLLLSISHRVILALLMQHHYSKIFIQEKRKK